MALLLLLYVWEKRIVGERECVKNRYLCDMCVHIIIMERDGWGQEGKREKERERERERVREREIDSDSDSDSDSECG